MSNHYRRNNGYEYDDGYPQNDQHRRIPSNISSNVTPPAPYYPPQNEQPTNAVRYRPQEGEQRYRITDDDLPKDVLVKPKITHPVPLLRLILDLILICSAWVPMILLKTFGKPFDRGFYCDDESIRYPLKPDTITPVMLYSIGAAVVIVTIVILECVIAFTAQNGRQMVYTIKGRNVHTLLSSLYIYIGYCCLGFLMVQISTDITKFMVGRLRPHFIDACDPDWSKINCTFFQYVKEPFCQNLNLKVVDEARVSFCSGHSSYSSYMMFYLVLYLQARWRWPGCSLLTKHFLQFAFVMLALFTGLSRLRDFKHHWSDVLAGFALGTLIACLTALHIGKFFHREARSKYESETNRSGVATVYPTSLFGARYAATDQGKHIY